MSAWNRDPHKAAQTQLAGVRDVKARLESLAQQALEQQAPAQQAPVERWLPLGRELDPRLPEEGDWPALAAVLHQGHLDGHDVAALARRLVAQEPLGQLPAQDLCYRLVTSLPAGPEQYEQPPTRTARSGAEQQRRDPSLRARTPGTGPRR